MGRLSEILLTLDGYLLPELAIPCDHDHCFRDGSGL
jgi:hypothetical protein